MSDQIDSRLKQLEAENDRLQRENHRLKHAVDELSILNEVAAALSPARIEEIEPPLGFGSLQVAEVDCQSGTASLKSAPNQRQNDDQEGADNWSELVSSGTNLHVAKSS